MKNYKIQAWIFSQKPVSDPVKEQSIQAWQSWIHKENLSAVCVWKSFRKQSKSKLKNTVLLKEGEHLAPSPWVSFFNTYHSINSMESVDILLVCDYRILPDKELMASLDDIMAKHQIGWFFSVSPLPFFVHNILIKKDRFIKQFEMPGLFTLDEDKHKFYNHISRQHFINSQDAPEVYRSDGRLCVILPNLFDLFRPTPHQFRSNSYRIIGLDNDRFRN